MMINFQIKISHRKLMGQLNIDSYSTLPACPILTPTLTQEFQFFCTKVYLSDYFAYFIN